MRGLPKGIHSTRHQHAKRITCARTMVLSRSCAMRSSMSLWIGSNDTLGGEAFSHVSRPTVSVGRLLIAELQVSQMCEDDGIQRFCVGKALKKPIVSPGLLHINTRTKTMYLDYLQTGREKIFHIQQKPILRKSLNGDCNSFEVGK